MNGLTGKALVPACAVPGRPISAQDLIVDGGHLEY